MSWFQIRLQNSNRLSSCKDIYNFSSKKSTLAYIATDAIFLSSQISVQQAFEQCEATLIWLVALITHNSNRALYVKNFCCFLGIPLLFGEEGVFFCIFLLRASHLDDLLFEYLLNNTATWVFLVSQIFICAKIRAAILILGNDASGYIMLPQGGAVNSLFCFLL